MESSEELRARYMELLEGMLALNAKVDEKLRQVEEKEHRYDVMLASLRCDAEAQDTKVTLNVGGHLFCASRSTLLSCRDTYFHALLGDSHWQPGDDGAYFIDRDPGLFSRILEALRTCQPLDFGGLSPKQAERLRDEVDYFLLPVGDLVKLRWDACRCGESLTITDDGRTATKTGGTGCNAGVLGTVPDLPTFQVRVRRLLDGGFMVGYARGSHFRTDSLNFNSSGWFLNCNTGLLHSGFGDRGRSYVPALKEGDLVKVIYDRTTASISFVVNGVDQGVAFTMVDNVHGPMYPCVEICPFESSASLED